MDKKRTQRILGILVIIALVIILFPLLFGKNELPTTQTTTLKSPPFPEQQATPDLAEAKPEVPAPINPNSDEESNTAQLDITPPTQSIQSSDATSHEVSPAIEMDLNNKNSNASAEKIAQPAIVESHDPAVLTVINESEKMDPANNIATPNKPAKPQAIAPVKKPVAKAKLAKKDLNKLNSKAWVIQMGSFKSKNNARQLVDSLRKSGYEAFTHEVKSGNGNVRTRVYIGPEFKQANAVQLSKDIQKEMMLQGVVMPYKPLAL